MTIRALCITEDTDRPTVATFLGLRSEGIEMTVVCPQGREARDTLADADIKLLDVPMRGRIDLHAIRRLRQELMDGEYDILHLFGNRALMNGLRASRGLPIRIIAYRGIVGNVSFMDPLSWARILNPRIDRIVCVADAVRNHLLQMRPAFLRMPESRLMTIYKGHSLDWYPAAPADLGELGIPESAFVIGCVANARPRKGIEYLVQAVGRLPEEWQVHLLLVGHMDVPRLAKAIAASPAAARIHRTGHRSDALALTAACDVFVLPSIRREGLARALIEAMALGVAPVATDCGGSSELVVDGVSGLVIPVRDADAIVAALGRLYRDEALRNAMGAAARERIRDHFRVEDTVARTLELYRGLATGARPAQSPPGAREGDAGVVSEAGWIGRAG